MTVEVEIGAYVLPDDHKVFKFFPGRSYKFYDLIRATSVAIIDVCGLDELDGKTGEWDADEVLDQISKDRVNRAVANGGRQPGKIIHSVGDKATNTFLGSGPIDVSVAI